MLNIHPDFVAGIREYTKVTCLPLTFWNVETWINVVKILSCDYYGFCSTSIWQ